MNEANRVSLVQALARLAAAETRTAAIAEVSSCLGIDSVLFFTADPERGVMLPAPGFPQTLPEAGSWRDFLAACVERHRHIASLPFSQPGETKSVTGLAWQNSAVLALVGRSPAGDVLDELALLLPLLASTVCHEQRLAMRASPGQPAGQVTTESTALARNLDQARRATQQEVAARKKAEKALKLVGDELFRANVELTRARDQALAASSTKDDFLAALSHELRTPLNPVLLIASEASENPDLPEAVRRDFATIAKNAQLEARLIDDLLDLTRITRGKMSLDNRSVDLRPVLEDAIATVRADLEAKKIDFAATFASRPHPVFGDSARLQQVFWNVLKNAVKFTPEAGRIRVETKLDDAARQIVTVFTDTGIGMTPSEVERVFDSFTEEDHATGGAHRFAGLGLGMTISQMLVHLHSGNIEAASAGREKGATFTVRLPLAVSYSPINPPTPIVPLAETETPFATTPPVHDPARIQARVLVVEDHEPTSRALARLLTRRGSDVVVAGSMAEALDAAETGTFDMVISDIGLPDGDGYSLMTVLKRRHRLQGIAVTGYGMQEDIARSEAAGFVAHVTKPVSVRALEVALELIQPVNREKNG